MNTSYQIILVLESYKWTLYDHEVGQSFMYWQVDHKFITLWINCSLWNKWIFETEKLKHLYSIECLLCIYLDHFGNSLQAEIIIWFDDPLNTLDILAWHVQCLLVAEHMITNLKGYLKLIWNFKTIIWPSHNLNPRPP